MSIEDDVNFICDTNPDDSYLNSYFSSFTSEKQSKYYSVDSINDIVQSTGSNLGVICYNIRSASRNLDQFLSFIASVDRYFQIMVFTETWNKDGCDMRISGFDGYHVVRPSCRGGGVSIYCDKVFISEKVSELSFVDENIEVCVVKLESNGRIVYIVAIYRPHSGTVAEFITVLSAVLNSDVFRGKMVILLGDFNINLIDYNIGNENVNSFAHSLFSLNFVPIITKPTRFPTGDQRGTATLLDQIWINRFSPYLSGIMLYDISDHLPVFIDVCDFNSQPQETVKVSFRDHSECNLQKFVDGVREHCWQLDMSADIDQLVSYFVMSIDDIYCKSFPMKTKHLSP